MGRRKSGITGLEKPELLGEFQAVKEQLALQQRLRHTSRSSDGNSDLLDEGGISQTCGTAQSKKKRTYTHGKENAHDARYYDRSCGFVV